MDPNEIKQVIVVRRDLRNTKGEKLRTGKLGSQIAHASLKVFFDMMKECDSDNEDGSVEYIIRMPRDMASWKNGIFTKICVAVDSAEQLMEKYNQALAAGLPCSLIEDHGLTEFGGTFTKTCCAIGPAKSEDIDKITGGLSLL